MSIEHWIILYLFINGTLCYIGCSDEWEDQFSPENIVKALIGAAFALPIATLVLLYEGLCAASKWMDGLIQFRTYWKYVFNRNALFVEDHDIITSLEEWGRKHRSSASIRDRLWRHAQSIIHRYNNYKSTS